MSRWSYIIPRIIILGLAILALWVSASAVTRTVVLNSIQNHTGGEVHIGQIRASLSAQKLYLQEVVIVDPQAKDQNLLQADMAYLNFDASALWQRKFVVTNGQTNRLMFGTPRSQASLATTAQPQTPSPANTIKVITQPTAEIGQQWLDDLQLSQETPIDTTAPHLTQTSQQITTFWQRELKNANRSITEIHQRTARLAELAGRELSNDNPLRAGRQDNTQASLDSMTTLSQQMVDKIAWLEEQYQSHLVQLDEALKLDAGKITPVSAIEFDGGKISTLLLAELHKDTVQQSVNMFSWFQNARPDIATDFATKHQRGTDIRIKGMQPSPDFLIQQIELNGEGRLLDQHFHFSGHAYDLSTQPQLHSKPARFELRAQGNQHVFVSCTLDRTGDNPQDTFHVDCPGVLLGERLLGHHDSLAVTLGSSNEVVAEINLQTTGENIAGTIQLRFSNVAMHVDRLNELAGGKPVALQMNQAVTSVRNFTSTIELVGDAREISFHSTSDLGERFAAAVNHNLNQQNESIAQNQKKQLANKKQQITNQLETQISQELKILSEVMSDHRNRIANLQENIDIPQQDRLRR